MRLQSIDRRYFKEDDTFLCEDCYIESRHKIQACDPWAVRSKKIFREEAGLVGTAGLTELQKSIYDFIVSNGGVKKEKIAEKFGISSREAENQFALLRHCELVKGRKGQMEYTSCLLKPDKFKKQAFSFSFLSAGQASTFLEIKSIKTRT